MRTSTLQKWVPIITKVDKDAANMSKEAAIKKNKITVTQYYQYKRKIKDEGVKSFSKLPVRVRKPKVEEIIPIDDPVCIIIGKSNKIADILGKLGAM